MLNFFRHNSLVLILGWTAIALTTTNVQAQPLTDAQKLEYKQTFDQRSRFADEHCVMHPKMVQGLEYSICRMEDIVMKVAIASRHGDNGPVAYLYGGRLYAFRDTDSGQALIFKKGRLMAEVEVGDGAVRSKIRTVFNQEERRSRTDRAISATRNMLKVFGQDLQL